MPTKPWSRSLIAVMIGLLFARGAVMAQAACPASVVVLAGTPVKDVPQTAAKVFIVDQAGHRGDALQTSPTAGSWTPNALDASTLGVAYSNSARNLEFADASGTSLCRPSFTVVSSPSPPSGIANGTAPLGVTATAYGAADCSTAGSRWQQELAGQPGHGPRFTELVFMESSTGSDANICYYNRDFGVVGDPIYVAVFGNNTVAWTGVTYSPCAAQAAAPNVLQSSDKFPSMKQSGAWQLYSFLERRCYNTSVDVSINGLANGNTSVSQRYALSQYDRYRGTLQAGVLFPSLHNSDFALRAVQTDTSKHLIYDRAPTSRGPEYIASLNLYSIFKYVPSIFGKADAGGYGMYPGRDPIHDQDFFDRIGAVLGAGITNPTQHFTAGVSFEVLYGVSVTWSAEFVQVNELADGVSTTTPFLGTAADIPTVRHWRERPTLGLSLDLRYLSLLLTGNR
jgi:hypothetical protein